MNPLQSRPETVAIVALGPSSKNYFFENSKKKNRPKYDEVWVVNSGDYIKCDKLWIMDDLRKIEKQYPEWALHLRDVKEPIVTCNAYPEYPTSVAFPLDEVTDNLKDDYFAVTPAYMIAYAIHIGVKTMYIYGCDFYYPGNVAVESGAACVCYWLGIARERKMVFKIPRDSTLLDAHLSRIEGGQAGRRYLYGYDYNPGRSFERISNGQAIELDHLVTAGGKIHTVSKQDIERSQNAPKP